MSSNSEKLFQNIGERLKKQREKEKDTEEEKKDEVRDKKEKDLEAAEDDGDISIDESTTNQKTDKEDQKKSTAEHKSSRGWRQQEEYQTSFKVKPDMDDDFTDCKRKFRRELNILLSKQDAIELGWLLLKNLDDSFFEELRVSYSPDDDLIAALKELIEEYY